MDEYQNFDRNYFKVLCRFKNNIEPVSTVSMENVAQCGAFFRPMFFDHYSNTVKIAEQWSIIDNRFFVIISRDVAEEDSIFRERSLGLCPGFFHI